MSRSGEITLDFGDNTYPFRLGYGELEQLQESLDVGPWYLMGLFASLGSFVLNPEAVRGLGVKMPREIIRLGLIGGGMKPVEALRLVRTYVEQRPPDESVGVAYEVLKAALHGAVDEPISESKKNETGNPNPSFPEERSGSEMSTALEPS